MRQYREGERMRKRIDKKKKTEQSEVNQRGKRESREKGHVHETQGTVERSGESLTPNAKTNERTSSSKSYHQSTPS